jgi:hypothetical protein
VAPIDRSPSGLPIGVQIIGPYLEDRTTIAFGGGEVLACNHMPTTEGETINANLPPFIKG